MRTIALDSDVHQGASSVGNLESTPMGHTVEPLRPLVVVSRSWGVLAYLDEAEPAKLWVEIFTCSALRRHRLLDFRLYRWCEDRQAWQVVLDTVELN